MDTWGCSWWILRGLSGTISMHMTSSLSFSWGSRRNIRCKPWLYWILLIKISSWWWIFIYLLLMRFNTSLWSRLNFNWRCLKGCASLYDSRRCYSKTMKIRIKFRNNLRISFFSLYYHINFLNYWMIIIKDGWNNDILW